MPVTGCGSRDFAVNISELSGNDLHPCHPELQPSHGYSHQRAAAGFRCAWVKLCASKMNRTGLIIHIVHDHKPGIEKAASNHLGNRNEPRVKGNLEIKRIQRDSIFDGYSKGCYAVQANLDGSGFDTDLRQALGRSSCYPRQTCQQAKDQQYP